MLTGCTRLRKEAEPVQPVTTTGGQMAEANAPGDDPSAAPLEEQWGVRIERASLSAGGYLVDFRFRVLDPAKATPVLDRAARPYLIDQATGARFIVPNPPKIGQLRSGRTIKKGAVYFVLFANPGKYVKSGNKITVVVGDFRACDIVVQ
jgi:hypothetical protein